jgi:hypothetical protein
MRHMSLGGDPRVGHRSLPTLRQLKLRRRREIGSMR